jgi:NitT/TauT family transport system substrate-binding protein
VSQYPPSWRARILPRLLLIAACGCSLALFAGYRARAKRADGAAGERIRVAAVRYIGACPVLAADANGYFAREGVAVDIHYEPSGKAALEAVLAGRAQLATVSEVPIMFAASSGRPVSVIATISAAARDHGVVGRVRDPKELAGKRVGVPLGTSIHFFLEAFLNRYGLSVRDVELHDLTPDLGIEAFRRGEIDAFAAWQPFLDQAAAAPNLDAHAFVSEGIYDVMYNLAGERNALAARQTALSRLLRAVVAGASFCEREPERALSMLTRVAQVDPKYFTALWPDFRFRVALDQGLLLALEDETRWAIKHHLSPALGLPNYLSFVDFAPLQAAAPGAITMVH